QPSPTTPTLAEMMAGLDGFDLFAEKDVARALVDYYSANPGFLWLSGGNVNSKAEQAIRLLGDADSYGLSPADYALAVPMASNDAADPAARNAELVRFEMTLSARVLRYVKDAEDGRVDPSRISG